MNLNIALAALTVPELRQIAAEANLAGRSKLRKAELVAALAEHPRTPRLLATRNLLSLRPESAAAEAGVTADPELRIAEEAEAANLPLPLTRRQAEHLVVIDQQRGDVPEAGFTREDWLAQGRESMEERHLDEPGANALSDAYRIVLGLMAPRDCTATPREQLIEEGIARGGWAAQSARNLREAIDAGRRSEWPSLTTRLRRDLAS